MGKKNLDTIFFITRTTKIVILTSQMGSNSRIRLNFFPFVFCDPNNYFKRTIFFTLLNLLNKFGKNSRGNPHNILYEMDFPIFHKNNSHTREKHAAWLTLKFFFIILEFELMTSFLFSFHRKSVTVTTAVKTNFLVRHFSTAFYTSFL